ncbi:hypothetical protein Btru_031735 [Bulinus truncatus]|nr:hypothetical protein Btru_031735 [Bulinus truncatus]
MMNSGITILVVIAFMFYVDVAISGVVSRCDEPVWCINPCKYKECAIGYVCRACNCEGICELENPLYRGREHFIS